LLTSVLEEAHMWELAGAQGLAHKDWLTPWVLCKLDFCWP
jgi:hypothetical protein